MSLKNIFNQQGGFSLLKKYTKNHVFFNAFFAFLFVPKTKKGLELFREYIDIKIYYRLKRKYEKKLKKKFLNEDLSQKCNSKLTKPKIIWFCWFQGIKNAPPLVHSTLKSIKENCPEYEIKIIDSKNLCEYTEIPSYILEKWKKGIISNAHFSDILRTNLLILHGGTWIDSTVLLTEKIPLEIEMSPIFFFRTFKPGSNGHCTNLSSWFISSEKNSKVLQFVQFLLFEYWKKSNYLCHYFLFHIFLEMIFELYPDLIRNMPKLTNENPHFMLFELANNFSLEKWNSIIKHSFCHKLTNRLTEDAKMIDETFYKHILERY